MKKLLCVFAAAILTLAHGYIANHPAPVFARCDQTYITAIKAYWLIAGTPSDVLNKLEESGRFVSTKTSYTYLNSGNKCIFLDFPRGGLNVTFVPKNGEPAVVLEYSMRSAGDGVLRGSFLGAEDPKYNFQWYQIYLDNGISAHYVCNSDVGSGEPPLVTIMRAERSLSDSGHASVLRKLALRIKEWGFTFFFNYGQECSGNDGT